MHLRYRQTCRVCGNPHLADVIDLGEQYLQGSFVKVGMPEPSRRKIPTKLVRCDVTRNQDGCGLVQMSVSTPPDVLYRSYWYQSGISATMREHLAGIVREVIDCLKGVEGLPLPRRVLDIACNDLTLLRNYPSPEFARWGVDPSDIARRSPASDITVINDLFPSSSRQLQYWNGSTRWEPKEFDAITSIAMLYDLEDPVTFCRAIKQHLAPAGLWVVELAYLPATLRQVSYDTIVGEHLGYYSLAVLERVFAMAGLRCFRAETNDINGGSIQCYVTHADCHTHDLPEWTAALAVLRTAEFDMALDTPAPYDLFKSQVTVQRDALLTLLREIKARGQVVAQYGSSTKANTLLQFTGLDHTDIPFAMERSEAKWGAKTLGTDIPIISEEEGRARQPDYVLVGPWHFKEEILRRERDTINGANGRKPIAFIFPLPTLSVVTHVPEVAA